VNTRYGSLCRTHFGPVDPLKRNTGNLTWSAVFKRLAFESTLILKTLNVYLNTRFPLLGVYLGRATVESEIGTPTQKAKK